MRLFEATGLAAPNMLDFPHHVGVCLRSVQVPNVTAWEAHRDEVSRDKRGTDQDLGRAFEASLAKSCLRDPKSLERERSKGIRSLNSERRRIVAGIVETADVVWGEQMVIAALKRELPVSG